MRHAEFVEVPCQVCGGARGEHPELLYSRELETVSFGRVERRLVACPGCGFLYATPRPSREALDFHYRRCDHASGAIWHASGEGSRHHRLTSYRAGFVARFVAETDHGRVLDVGCAQGDLLAGLELPGWTRVGLEPSSAAAEKARARGLTVVEASLEHNPLPSGAYDLVTCISVLEHVWDVREAMSALERLLAPGGHLALYVPDSSRPVAHVAEFFSFEHLSHFTAGSITRLLVDFGLRPLEIERAEGPGLMVCARKEGRAAVAGERVPDDRQELHAALERYRMERASFERGLRERFDGLRERWKAERARVAVYGAGEHTQFLLELCDLGPHVVAILDSDPRKHGRRFLRWRVDPPERAVERGVDAIVLSSRPYQDEMHAAVAPLAAEHGIEIVRCYPRERTLSRPA